MIRPLCLFDRRRQILASAATAAALLAASAASAPQADAAFSITKCGGDAVAGAGATFANAAQASFKSAFTPFCDPETAPDVTYNGGTLNGSGYGRRIMGERTAPNGDGSLSRTFAERFGGTDEPLSTVGKQQIEQGKPAAGDEALVHQIPVAAGAVAPLVNFPDDCVLATVAAGNQTNPGATDFTNRVRFNRDEWERIWNGDAADDEWGELLPGITGTNGKTNAQCQDQLIKRVVRFDNSGSTFAFKDALEKYEPSRGWKDVYTSDPVQDTRKWPNADFGVRTDCDDGNPATPLPSGPGAPTSTDPAETLVSSCSSGGGALATKLNGTDGSVGYVDLATAVSSSAALRVTPAATAAARDDDKYLTQLPNGSGTFVEATLNQQGFKTNVSPTGAAQPTEGANCANTQYDNLPTSTLGAWTNVSGTDSNFGYGICTLTYVLAFDDYADAYGTNDVEQRKARTVKDYLTNAVSATDGQQLLVASNYRPLTAEIRNLAQAGVNRMNWNVTGGGGGTPPPSGGGVTPPPSGGGVTPKPAPAIPSNVFSIPRRSISSRTGRATLSIRVPGAGRITVLVRAKNGRKRFTVANIRRSVSSAGTYKITIKPNRTARRILKRKGKLKTSVKVTYQPNGGTARSSTKSLTLKLKRKRRRG